MRRGDFLISTHADLPAMYAARCAALRNGLESA